MLQFGVSLKRKGKNYIIKPGPKMKLMKFIRALEIKSELIKEANLKLILENQRGKLKKSEEFLRIQWIEYLRRFLFLYLRYNFFINLIFYLS